MKFDTGMTGVDGFFLSLWFVVVCGRAGLAPRWRNSSWRSWPIQGRKQGRKKLRFPRIIIRTIYENTFIFFYRSEFYWKFLRWHYYSAHFFCFKLKTDCYLI